jgi:hypothetical protein
LQARGRIVIVAACLVAFRVSIARTVAGCETAAADVEPSWPRQCCSSPPSRAVPVRRVFEPTDMELENPGVAEFNMQFGPTMTS